MAKKKKTKKNPVTSPNTNYYGWPMPSWSWDTGYKPEKPEPVMYVAVYSEMVKGESYIDAHESFTSKKNLMAWLKIDKNCTSLKVFEVKGEFKTSTTVKLKKVK